MHCLRCGNEILITAAWSTTPSTASHPATTDADGGFWCALVQGGQLARFVAGNLERTLALPVVNPTDVTFGGRDLDRLYVVSIGGTELDGALLVIDGLDVRGRPEPRFTT